MSLCRVHLEPALRADGGGVFEQDGEWFIAYCPEVPGANGQGKTKDDARVLLQRHSQRVTGVLNDRRLRASFTAGFGAFEYTQRELAADGGVSEFTTTWSNVLNEPGAGGQ